jgi:two-component system chemotaxis response regulator CheB
MPTTAIRHVAIDHVLRVEDMASILSGLIATPIERNMVTGGDETRQDSAEEGAYGLEPGGMPGPPSVFTCPECGGTLWEIDQGDLICYRCHVGHAYNGNSLVAAKSDDLEAALWTALRTLEENATLRRRMANHARERGMTAIAESYEEHAAETEERARLVRRILVTDVTSAR